MTSSEIAATPANRRAPWYREPWPWLLMGGPALVVVACLFTAWLAVTSDDGVVADDYYKRGLSINQQLQRGERAAALQLAATVDVTDAGEIRVALDSPSPDPEARPAAIRLSLTHPTRAGQDRRAELVRGPDGRYAGRIEPAPPGRWRVIVETDAWRLPTAEVTGAVRDVQLRAAAPRP
jgi:hypothetical protein